VLNHGRSMGTFDKGEISMAELEKMMAGGKELDQLSTELEGVSRPE
jgi:simple sugar transport system ATP-binding protein